MLWRQAVRIVVCLAAGASGWAQQPSAPKPQTPDAVVPPDKAAYWRDTGEAAAPVQAAARETSWEFGVQAAGGVGLEDRSDFGFLMLGGHAGKVLTPELGSGVL